MKLADIGQLSDAEVKINELTKALTAEKDRNAALKLELSECEKTIDRLESENSTLNDEVRDLEERVENELAGQPLIDAVDRFLDEVGRPVGTCDFDVPKSPAVGRAIAGLYDAIRRVM